MQADFNRDDVNTHLGHLGAGEQVLKLLGHDSVELLATPAQGTLVDNRDELRRVLAAQDVLALQPGGDLPLDLVVPDPGK